MESFIQKIERFEPSVVAFNGERAARKVARYLSLVYRLPSSSSAKRERGYGAKRAKWVEFGGWVRDQVSGSSSGGT